jgi:hypothetical protein
MTLVRELAVRAGILEHRRDRRLSAQQIHASYSAGAKPIPARVKNISSTGIYLLTSERWPPGTYVDLSLRRRSALEDEQPPSVHLRARIVRIGLDGVGLVFEPEHVGTDIWMNLVMKAVNVSVHKDAVRVLRVSRALAFLRRVSPAAESKVLQHIAGESIYESGERAVETILNAEVLVDSWKLPIRTGVSPEVILRILENTSRANLEWVRQHWAGMLASSVQYWARDRESLQFAAMLSNLDPVQIRILDTACNGALRAERHAGYYFVPKLTCSTAVLQTIAGLSDLVVIERHLDCLYRFNLLEPTIKNSSFEHIDRANLTPTETGLRLYARCKGLLNPPEGPSHLRARALLSFPAGANQSEQGTSQAGRMYAPAS